MATLLACLIVAAGASGCLSQPADEPAPDPSPDPSPHDLRRQELSGSQDALDRFELAILELLESERGGT